MFDTNGKSQEDILKNLLCQLSQMDSVVRVHLNDQRLMKLAEYDTTKGYMNTKVSPEELQARFNELKTRVKSGSYTLKTLEDDVYSRWGVTEESREEILQNEMNLVGPQISVTGFKVDDMDIADISEDDPDNT
jgi:methyl coenzyme M reductase subunit D